MSRWRQLALELFPEHKIWIENGRETFSIYMLFLKLVPLTYGAHDKQNRQMLVNTYQFTVGGAFVQHPLRVIQS